MAKFKNISNRFGKPADIGTPAAASTIPVAPGKEMKEDTGVRIADEESIKSMQNEVQRLRDKKNSMEFLRNSLNKIIQTDKFLLGKRKKPPV